MMQNEDEWSDDDLRIVLWACHEGPHSPAQLARHLAMCHEADKSALLAQDITIWMVNNALLQVFRRRRAARAPGFMFVRVDNWLEVLTTADRAVCQAEREDDLVLAVAPPGEAWFDVLDPPIDKRLQHMIHPSGRHRPWDADWRPAWLTSL